MSTETIGNTKTTKKATPKARKVAPDIIVTSTASRKSIDNLHRDNPGKNFLYVPAGSSDSSLSVIGLKLVKGSDGRPLRVGSRVICQDVGTSRKKEIGSAHAEATSRIEEINDPKQVNSKPKTAVAKKPKS